MNLSAWLRRILLIAVVAMGVSLTPAQNAQDKAKKKEDYKGPPAGRMVHFSGQVQGVGFRATAERIARDYPVTGWVKNLNDGRVQLLVEGPGDAVQDFLQAIRTHWKDNIKKEETQEQPVTGKYKEFKTTFE
jgi:acylphosphatase